MWPDDETPEPAAWINFNAATGERNVSFICESELASIPLWREPPRGRKQDEALIRQMLAALDVATTPLAKDRQEVLQAIAAARAWLDFAGRQP